MFKIENFTNSFDFKVRSLYFYKTNPYTFCNFSFKTSTTVTNQNFEKT